jgi:hypothetical protein
VHEGQMGEDRKTEKKRSGGKYEERRAGGIKED